ncbi:hypothetical protein PS880_04986 [Pseudomonas fluorescens]|uniref:Uncharacterized protein n=1 Tax=Pseudomonas fluorescens TaxID=294 RepID=A0A5E7P231_PSEFL|nr:hypothetical protein PS880_04986 [Pseudomonas fluorescens]
MINCTLAIPTEMARYYYLAFAVAMVFCGYLSNCIWIFFPKWRTILTVVSVLLVVAINFAYILFSYLFKLKLT